MDGGNGRRARTQWEVDVEPVHEVGRSQGTEAVEGAACSGTRRPNPGGDARRELWCSDGLHGGDELGVDHSGQLAEQLTDVGLYATAPGEEGEGVECYSWSQEPTTMLRQRTGAAFRPPYQVPSTSFMDVSQQLGVIWRRKWLVLAVSLLVAAGVYALSARQADVYRAEALVSLQPARATGDSVDESTTLFLARNYAELATTRPVLDLAVKNAKLPISRKTADHRLSVSAASDVGFLKFSATGPTPRAAARLAQGAADALLSTVETQQGQDLDRDLGTINADIDALERQLSTLPAASPARTTLEAQYDALVNSKTERRLQPTDRLTLRSAAFADNAPVAPNPKRNALLAFLVALVLNGELMVLREALGDRFTSGEINEEVLRITGLPVLARVPRGDDEAVAEAFNSLRTNLLFMDTVDHVRTMSIVSVDPGAGKSFTAIHLALSFQSLGVRTVLVDGDIRRPVIHERLGVERAPGFTEVLDGRAVAGAIRPVPGEPGLRVLPAGSPVQDPAGLLGGRPLRKLFDSLDAELVVVDTPAENLFADALAIASQCHIVVLVIDIKSSRRRAVRNTVQRLRQVNANLVGVLINRADLEMKPSYYTRYRDKESFPAARR